MHATLTRIAAIVMVISCGLTSSACDAQTEERKAIKDVIKRLETAYQEKRGHDAAELVTPACLTYYGELLKVAVDGKRADVQARPAMDRYEILLIRQKSSRKRLKGLDGRGYQTFTTDQGWWSFPEIDSLTDNMAHIQIDKDGTKAWTQIVEGLKPTMFRIEFAKIDGQWRVNELTIRAYSSHQYEKEARQAGMNLNRYLELIVGEETDAPIRDGIWDPHAEVTAVDRAGLLTGAPFQCLL